MNIQMGLLHDVTLKVRILGVQGIGIRSPQMRARLRAVAESAKVQPGCRLLTCDLSWHDAARKPTPHLFHSWASSSNTTCQSRDGS